MHDVSGFVRIIVDALLWPVIVALVIAVAVAVLDVGVALGERGVGLRAFRRFRDRARIVVIARQRIGRADMLARLGPMLGLMGTLIPLGPGLAALGRGDASSLAAAMTVAFDTTVLGLLVGILGFVLGRLRRRWYDDLLDRLEAEDA